MLYIVGTPIGNLDDLSLRQAKTLAQSDIILAEDTRSAKILLDAIKERFPQPFPSLPNHPKLISYYKEKEFEKLPEVITFLKEGMTVSLISESGIPLISDPGYLLVKTVIKEKIPFTVIPGPSAITTALIHSGLNPSEFIFLGFFPKKPREISQLLAKIMSINKLLPNTIFVAYDSPNRINSTLSIIDQTTPNMDICICREMTKKFEEIVRGKANELKQRTYKGELTLVMLI